jgi:hypothetical protein
MAHLSRSGSYELNCNRILLPPPWQKDNLPHIANHINNSKKRKLDTINKNINTSQNAPSTNHITNYNRFDILESIHDFIDDTETLSNQHTQKVPPPPPNIASTITAALNVQAFILHTSALNLQIPRQSASSVKESILRNTKVAQPTRPCLISSSRKPELKTSPNMY